MLAITNILTGKLVQQNTNKLTKVWIELPEEVKQSLLNKLIQMLTKEMDKLEVKKEGRHE